MEASERKCLRLKAFPWKYREGHSGEDLLVTYTGRSAWQRYHLRVGEYALYQNRKGMLLQTGWHHGL